MILKIIVIGISAAFLSVTIKKINPEASFAIAIASSIVLLLIILPDFTGIINSVTNIAGLSGIPNEYLKLILKVIGIGYITEFSASVANDAGESSIAQKIEFAGRISIMIISMPLFVTLINMITGLLP